MPPRRSDEDSGGRRSVGEYFMTAAHWRNNQPRGHHRSMTCDARISNECTAERTTSGGQRVAAIMKAVMTVMAAVMKMIHRVCRFWLRRANSSLRYCARM